jgi:putative transposase
VDKRLSQRKATQKRRKTQTCKVYEAKIDRSHLSASAVSHLSSLFKEAKWFYNFCLSHDDVDEVDTKLRTIPVKVGDKDSDEYEDRDLSVLQAQMKQGIQTRLFGSLMSLAALKEKGFKVGRLKFKGAVNSIPLKQYDKTYFIRNGKVRIQGLKQWLRVNGLDQIPADAEIANATLVRRHGDFYIHVTTYQEKEVKVVPNAVIGIDFGCDTQLTFSNGVKVKFQVPPSKRLRRLDRKIMRRGKKARSNNKTKDQIKRQKEYERVTNKKKDIRHKLVSAITNNYRYVAFQDDSIHAWAMGGHGKKVQHSGIGGILSDLKHKSVTPLEVDKFFPSTKLCPQCGKKNSPTLADRTYECDCGFVMDRDLKSSICIENEGLKQIPTDCREFTLGEISTSTFMGALANIHGIHVSKLESLNQEAAARSGHEDVGSERKRTTKASCRLALR